MADELDPFDLDPGRAPAEGDERQAEEPDEAAAAAVALEAPLFSEERAGELWEWLGLALNAISGAPERAPEDVYLFTDRERRLLASATSTYVSRHTRLAAVAEKSDVAIIAGVTGRWALRETGRLRAFRAAQAETVQGLERESPRSAGAVRPVEPQ